MPKTSIHRPLPSAHLPQQHVPQEGHQHRLRPGAWLLGPAPQPDRDRRRHGQGPRRRESVARAAVREAAAAEGLPDGAVRDCVDAGAEGLEREDVRVPFEGDLHVVEGAAEDGDVRTVQGMNACGRGHGTQSAETWGAQTMCGAVFGCVCGGGVMPCLPRSTRSVLPQVEVPLWEWPGVLRSK